jgi:Ca2+:H+ antiporter
MSEETQQQAVHSESFRSLISIFHPGENKLNWLLLLLPVSIYFSLNHQLTLAFFSSMLAIAPLAFLMGKATEEIAIRTGESIGGLLNATFGNAVEMIIAGMALYAASTNPDILDTMVTVTQASLIGSILGNLLLVLGLSIVWGGIRHNEQSFSRVGGEMNGALLVIAIACLIIPSAMHHSGGTTEDVLNLSRATALIMLIVYGCSLLFQLKTHSSMFESSEHGEHEEPELSLRDSWILLLTATILVGWMAHILVHSLEEAVTEYAIPELFIGVILLPFFGNAAEHFTAVLVAGKGKMDLSMSIAIGSSIQIALFVAPVMVLLGWALGVSLPLEFGLLETAATFVAVLITIAILNDGKTNWLEGVLALACYTILGIAFFFM